MKKNLFSQSKERNGKGLRLFSAGLFGLSLLMGSFQIQAQEFEPMKIASGFNEDVIAETSPATDHTTSSVDGTNAGANYAFMSVDYPSANTGLPVNGIINSISTEDLRFKLADYTGNNSLRISGEGDSGILELEESVSAKKIFILATSGDGNSSFSGIIHFADESTQGFGTQTAYDWFSNSGVAAIQGIGRVSRANGSLDNNTSNPKIFQIEIAIDEENQDKEITEISIEKTSTSGFLNVMGVSREYEADCPKPTEIVADNITTDSADISWAETDSEETTWTIIYGESGFDAETEGDSSEVEEPNFTVNNLLPNTAYQVYVQAHCSETEDSNLAGPYTFTTACGAQDIPFLEDFENLIVPDIPNCSETQMISGGQNWKTSGQSLFGMPAGFYGNVLYFQYTFFSDGDANAWYFTEGINLEAGNTYQISYKYGNNSTSYTEKMKVAYGTSQEADAMTNELADYPNISDAQVHLEEINFEVDEDGVYYFGFQAYSVVNQYYLIIDDISVDFAPSCIKPGDLSAENILETSADLSWTDFNDGNEWEVVYGQAASDFDPETDGTSITVNGDAAVSLENLSANTNYVFYVKAICSEDDQSAWSIAYTFTTACGIMDVPYTEDFESVSTPNLPNCTSFENISGNAWKTTGFASGFDGNVLNYSYHFSDAANAWFFTPGINMEAGVNYQISYKYGNSGTWEESLKTAFGTSDSSTDMVNELGNHPNFTGTHQGEIYFTVPEDGVYYFGFQAYSDGNQNQLYVDDIEIKEAPACLEPINIQINQDSTTAEITWTAQEGASQWEVVYGEVGFDPETGGVSVIVEDEAETTLIDLESGTTYEVYVKTICGEGDESEWSESAEFTTTCAATTVPFFQNFENVNAPEVPVCATLENAGTGNNWAAYDPSASGNFSIPIGFEGNVLSYKYDLNNAANAWYFTQGIELEAGVNYQISYKYGNGDASGAVEKMKVKMGTSPNSSAMNAELADHPNITEISSETNYLVFTVEDDGVYYFGFNAYSDTNQYYLFLDDIAIDYGPSCPAPTNINFEYITDASVMVNWTSGQENTAWEIIYGEAGFDPQTGGETMETSSTSGNIITGLDAETDYDVYVKAICDGEMGEIAGSASFTTKPTPPENTYLCNAIELFANDGCTDGPYTNVDAFEEANEPFGSCLNNFRGTNSVWFTFVATAEEATITTDFNTTDFTTEISVFEAPTDCTDMETLGEDVGCAANGSDAELTGLTVGENYYVKVTGFNNTSGNFCIEVQMDDDNQFCEAPTNIEVIDITDNQVTVVWSPSAYESQWEVAYGLTGFDLETEGQTEVVDTNTIVLADLEAETDYDVYVRAICNADQTSDWAGPETFTTEPMSVNSEAFNNLNYYPNPVQNVLTLKASAQIEKVEVFNLLGQSVIIQTPDAMEVQLATDQLQSGVYLMKVIIDRAERTFRIVKK